MRNCKELCCCCGDDIMDVETFCSKLDKSIKDMQKDDKPFYSAPEDFPCI